MCPTPPPPPFSAPFFTLFPLPSPLLRRGCTLSLLSAERGLPNVCFIPRAGNRLAGNECVSLSFSVPSPTPTPTTLPSTDISVPLDCPVRDSCGSTSIVYAKK
eukprot:RCo032695